MDNSAKGLLYIIGGAILFLLAGAEFIFRAVIVLGAILLINYGLHLRGQPPLWGLVRQWLDELRF